MSKKMTRIMAIVLALLMVFGVAATIFSAFAP